MSTVCLISNQTIFKVETEKPKTEKIRGIQGLTNFHDKGDNNAGTLQPYRQPRAGSYVRTIWPGGLQYAGDAAAVLRKKSKRI